MHPAVVLLVEDDPDIRQDLAELLREEGYRVETAPNGAVALELLRSGLVPCVILLDLMMPVMDGWRFRAEQQKDPAFARLPVVVVSGATDVQQLASSLSAADFIRKPIDLDGLIIAIQRFCVPSAGP